MRDRGSSLRSLRPHHSRIPPAQAFRQSWLRCERVKQRVITTGRPASEDINIAIGETHAELHQLRNVISDRNGLRIRLPCSAATPGPDEFDNREIWNEDEALAGIEEAIHILAGAVAPDGTQLADERESLLWGFVNALHAQVQRLDRGIDKIAPEMKDLGQEQDGSEIKSRELELRTDRVQNLGDRRDAFEAMRDLAAEGYRAETGDTWRPRNGSHSSQTGKLTSAAIDARDYLRAREHRETSAHLPEGTLVAFTGGKDFDDVTAIWRSLDSIKIKYDDMVLLHGGGPGAEKIAASWAEKNGVHQVVCKPDWGRDGKAAPFRRKRCPAELPAQGPRRLPWLWHHQQHGRQSPQGRNPRPARHRVTAPYQGRSPSPLGAGPAFFCAGWLEQRPMAGRFAPPPYERASTRLRTSRLGTSRHRRTRALTRHAIIPPCYFIVRVWNHNDGSPCFEGRITVLQTKVRIRSAQNGSLPSSVDPRLSAPEATLFRNVRKLRSLISIPSAFNTSHICATVTSLPCCSSSLSRRRFSTSVMVIFGGASFARAASILPKSISASLYNRAHDILSPHASRIR